MARIQIQILIDDSSRLHLQDAGGVIIIRQGAEEARTEYLLVDYWLMQLIDGLHLAKKKALGLLGNGNSEVWIDFSEDRTSIQIQVAGPRVLLQYTGIKFKTNLAEFEIELRQAVLDFVLNFREDQQYDKIPSYQVLEKFIVGEQ